MSQPLFSFLTSQQIPASSNYLMTSINTNEALELLQYYLWERAECHYVLEHNTNSILASLISQLQDLYTLVSNLISTLVDILPLISRPLSLINTSIPRNLPHYS